MKKLLSLLLLVSVCGASANQDVIDASSVLTNVVETGKVLVPSTGSKKMACVHNACSMIKSGAQETASKINAYKYAIIPAAAVVVTVALYKTHEGFKNWVDSLLGLDNEDDGEVTQ